MTDSILKASTIKRRHEAEWLAIGEVVAVGIGLVGKQQVGIIVSVSQNPGKIRKLIPNSIEGVLVKIQETGKLYAQ